MNESNLEIHIDTLELDGLGRMVGAVLSVALEHALSRRFRDEGIPSLLMVDGQHSSLVGGIISSTARTTPDILASRIASAVYSGMIR